MKVSIRFFASLKETLKTDELHLELPAQIQTIAELRSFLATRGVDWGNAFAPEKNIRAAQALELVDPQTVLIDGAEIAFFPPVTGG